MGLCSIAIKHIILTEKGYDSVETANADALLLRVIIKYIISGQESIAQVNQFPFLIGRDVSAVNLVLMHRTVSRIHAKLIYQDGVVLLENVSTTNCAAINGRYIDHPTKLSTGDEITIGACHLMIEIVSSCE